jgi:hypothetical protein
VPLCKMKCPSIADVGEQTYHFVDSTLDSDRGTICHENCFFSPIVGKGDSVGLPITGVDIGAAKIRTFNKRKRKQSAGSARINGKRRRT